uniref:Uncharacterized protein n=1 Tax=Elaeophora elaphi TaxID=1147741 RepID=A0A0R3RLG7_9BILA
MSEIKSKHQNDELNDEFRKTIFTTNGSRMHDVGNTESRLACESEYNRSLYEQGKAHYLGSRTPEMPRRSFTFASSHHLYPSDTESMHQPQWRIRSSVERSSSAVDIDGFTSMRRRKADDNAIRVDVKPAPPIPPAPYPRNCSLFSDRLRRDRSSPSHLPINFSTTEKYSISRDLDDVNAITKTATKNIISNGAIENNFVQLTNGDALLAVGSNELNNGVNVNGLCFQCYNLQKQLSDLSSKLKEATDEMKSKEVGELGRKRKEETVIVVDKGVGGSCEMLNDGIIDRIQVEKKDAANDALLIQVEDKVNYSF